MLILKPNHIRILDLLVIGVEREEIAKRLKISKMTLYAYMRDMNTNNECNIYQLIYKYAQMKIHNLNLKELESTISIKDWLKDVYYDEFGQYLWSKQDADSGSQMIGEIRGWGALQKEFKTQEECAKFQDEVGKFIADAINEKIKKDFN